MPMKLSHAALLLVVCILCAAFSMRLFQGLDEMMGSDYWVVQTSQGDHGWYAMGLLPHLKNVPKDVVTAVNTDDDPSNNMIIYAQSGDFAGNSVYGITFGIPLIMYLIWFAFILGFPDRVDPYLLPRRIFTIAVIIACSVVVNLFLMRIAADFIRDPMSRIANVAGNHSSLLFHNAGIWFAILFRPWVPITTPTMRPRHLTAATGRPRLPKNSTGCSPCWPVLPSLKWPW